MGRYYRGIVYHIEIKNPQHIQRGIIELEVDGKKILGNTIPFYKDSKIHNIIAIMRKT
ncbi:MAG TPA: hypothetical protein VIK72_12890 [Clostridiaceae bacterium]